MNRFCLIISIRSRNWMGKGMRVVENIFRNLISLIVIEFLCRGIPYREILKNNRKMSQIVQKILIFRFRRNRKKDC